MPVADWLDLMNTEVTYQNVIDRDGDNEPTYGSPQTSMCRISYSLRNSPSIGAPGTQIATRGSVWFPLQTGVDADTIMTLDTGETLHIVFVEKPYDETGEIHHIKATFT